MLTTSLPAADNKSPDQEIFLDGEWISFVKIDGKVVYKPSTSYIFHQNKTWCMQTNNALPIEQGEIKYGSSSNVYLYVKSDQGKKEAIPAKILDNNTLEIANHFESKIKLLLVKESSLQSLNTNNICGVWFIRQKNPVSNDIRKSEYILHINKDHSYEIKHPEKALDKTLWAKGSWSIKNDLLYLENKSQENNFWKNPVFFLYKGNLIFNQHYVFVWCSRQ